jgi:hypothetical protein
MVQGYESDNYGPRTFLLIRYTLSTLMKKTNLPTILEEKTMKQKFVCFSA